MTNDINLDYENVEKWVQFMLTEEHKISKKEAKQAIKMFPIKNVIEENPKLKRNISYTVLAKEVYKRWKNTMQ